MVDWLTVFASVSLSALGSLAVTEFQLRRERSLEESAEVEEWYGDCYSYASQVRRNWNNKFGDVEGYEMNLGELQSKLSLLETQISRHASEGERMNLDDEVIDRLDKLAEKCREATNRPLHNNSAEEFSEIEDDILEAAGSVEESVDNR
jgi:hypothetical protein